MFDSEKQPGVKLTPRNTTLNIEWGQIDPKGNRRVKGIHTFVKFYI